MAENNNSKVRNYGLLEPKKLPIKEKIFGSDKRLKAQRVLVEDGNWKKYLPRGEYQQDKETKRDTMACVSFSINSALEAIFKYYIENNILDDDDMNWLDSKGYFLNDEINFSDRFTAVMSETSKYGNSMHNVIETIRKYGLIPQVVWEYPPLYNKERFIWKSWMTYPPQSVLDLGREFLKRFEIGYEAVFRQWEKALSYSPLVTGIHAYCYQRYNIYQYCSGTLNHAVMIFKPKWKIFDSYEEGKDDYVKDLVPHYRFLRYSYKFSVKPKFTKLNFNRKIMLDSDNEFIRTPNGAFHFSKKGTNKVQKVDSIGGVLTIMDRCPGKKAENITQEKFEELEQTREFFAGNETDIKDE